jgi:hypothetical protein
MGYASVTGNKYEHRGGVICRIYWRSKEIQLTKEITERNPNKMKRAMGGLSGGAWFPIAERFIFGVE